MNKNNIDFDITELISEALAAREKSYSPYSSFSVGAALLCSDGSIVHGCNIENSSYSATNCAERTAVFSAIANGKNEYKAIAIVGGYKDKTLEMCYPCGVCRQVLAEFCDNNSFIIIVATNTKTYEIYTLDELLPKGFAL